jgi:O-antigen/teichoic acid export membrane protein
MNIRVYLRQSFMLLFGNGAAQLINLASYVILARLYAPAEFGGFALFMTVVGVFGPIACGRFDLIIQSAPDRQLPALIARARRANILVSTALAAVSMAFAAVSGKITLIEGLLLGAGVFLTGWVLTSNARLIRAEQYSVASKTTVIRSAATAVTQVALAFLNPTALGLIIGFCVGFAVQALFLTRAMKELPGPRSTQRRDRFIMARYASQISLDIPTAVILGTVLNIMNFLVLDLYSREEVGYYSMAFRVAALPLTLVSGALSEVFYQKASASFRATQGFWRELKFNLLLTLSISIFIIIPIGILAPPIFAIAFGPQWERAGHLVICLLPLLAVRLVTDSVQIAPLIIGHANWRLATQLALLGVIGLTYAAAKVLRLPIEEFLTSTSLLMAAVYASFVILLASTVRRNYRGVGARKAQTAP